MNEKHAYLIMAHTQFDLLSVLLELLDCAENDIYLHIDKKVKNVDINRLDGLVRSAELTILNTRIDVEWGTYSQIECELQLLEEATKKRHSYYHLMSGVDLPLKSQKEIHDFFKRNMGTEYIHFDAPQIDPDTYNRVSKYVFFASRKKKLWEKVAFKILMTIEHGVDRGKKVQWIYQKGANWFSITDALARYVLDQRPIIEKQFRFTRCADEVFLQTLAYNSEFKNHIAPNNYCDNYETICYDIDWKRGNPYVFRITDFDTLINSDMLFARKFDWNVDKDIVLKIKDYIRKVREE